MELQPTQPQLPSSASRATGQTTTVAVDGVPSLLVPFVWPGAWPKLKRAIDRVPVNGAKPTEAELFEELLTTKAQLWAAWDMDALQLIGAVLTAIQTDERFPGCRYVHCRYCGGERLKAWFVPMWGMLKAWGRAHNCTHMMVPGREGWVRLLGLDYLFTDDDGTRVYVRSLKEH